jgi:hypothetical protein
MAQITVKFGLVLSHLSLLMSVDESDIQKLTAVTLTLHATLAFQNA